MSKLYFIIVLQFVYCSAITESENLTKRNAGFIFSMPKTLVSGKNETVCLSIHNGIHLKKAVIDIKWINKHFPTVYYPKTDNSCFEMYVPDLEIHEPNFVSIRVQVQINGMVYSSHNQDPVLLYNKKFNKTFIDTDKEYYKPGQKLNFRILVLDDKNIPLQNKISEIKIKNPLDITVAVWDNVVLQSGLAQLEYQLVPESLTGKWKIDVLGTIKAFEVYKHVLPRFKIDLRTPKSIYHETESLQISICAEYSFHKPVKGIAFIRITDSLSNMQALVRSSELINGCKEFNFSNHQLLLPNIRKKFPMYDPKMNLHVTATVTEYGTNKIHITSNKILVSMMAYNLKFISKQIFQPGLPYKGRVQLNNINADINGELIEICYNVAIRKSWNYLNNEQCRNFSVGHDNGVDFNLLPFKNNIVHVLMNVRSLNHTNIGDRLLAIRLYSPSGSYISLEQNAGGYNGECNSFQEFTVTYSTEKFEDGENVTFYYMVKTHNQLNQIEKITRRVRKMVPNYLVELNNIIGSKTKYTKLGLSIDKFNIKFKITEKSVSKYQLVVYYVTNTLETVASTKTVNIRPCLFSVSSKWSENRVTPGALNNLVINTDGPALCSVTSIDKSVTYLNNNHQIFNLNTLLRSSEEREAAQSMRKTCVPPTKKGSEASSLTESEANVNSKLDLRRRKRHAFSFAEDFDSYDIFNKFGTIIISNFKMISKPCYNGPVLEENNEVQFLTSQYLDDENEDNNVQIRHLFPETWLWELVPVSSTVQLTRQVPHSITSWLTNVLCVSQTDGIGFSKEMEVITFQKFFVDVIVPYSIKKEENFYLYVKVFNYLSYNYPVTLTLRMSSGLELRNLRDKLKVSHCVPQNDSVTHVFALRGTEIGVRNISVIAEVDNQYPEPCGPETLISKRDAIYKSILVESEGYPVTKTQSALICVSDSQTTNNVSWTISTPPNIIKGTDKAYIHLNGDLLGQSIGNLEDLLSIPRGCGEQIMASIAPNLYILKYLNATGNLTPLIRQRIVRNLKMGYQRILNYAHKDGSFSAFGYHDPSGSMFLTAFVVRTLQEAKQYIYVDQRVIDRAVSWIYFHQLENGCFNTMYHVFQDMGGTSSENSTAGLTSYVMISLIEANIDVPDSVKTNAKYCIRSQINPDQYTLAISSYGLFEVKWYDEGRRYLNKLISMAHQQQNMMWWGKTDSQNSSSTDLEITSYVLLSLLHQNTTENLARAENIVHWLSSKIGPRGGFKSTQDTVVTLDALTKYSMLLRARKLNLKIHIKTIDKIYDEKMKQELRLKSKKIQLQHTNNHIEVYVFGEGCVLAQTTVSYYVKEIPRSEAFKLAVEVAPVSTIDKCSVASLSPCVTYTGPDDQSNMAVLEMTLPSGYQADRASLFKLLETESNSHVKMFEEINNQVIFYFTKLDKQQICINFNINENNLIENRKDSTAKLYDYYKPEYESFQMFTMNMCQNNDSLTSIPEIIDNQGNMKMNGNSEEISSKNVVKRFAQINPNFVDKDIEMDTPDGCEGTKGVYIKLNKTNIKN